MTTFPYPLTTLATIMMLVLYGVLAGLVSGARGKYGVPAPAITGDIEFEKRHRVHMNTLEQLVMTLPALWLTALWLGDAWAALGGLVWVVGRVIYARGYFADPSKRGTGFNIGLAATSVLMIAPLVMVALHYLKG